MMHHNIELTEWQRHFISWAKSSDRKQAMLLEAIPGSGKTTALVALAAALSRTKPESRVLIAIPSPSLLGMYKSEFERIGEPTPDAYSASSYWDDAFQPTSLDRTGVTVATFGLIRRVLSDNTDDGFSWDMVIVDGELPSADSLFTNALARNLSLGRITRLLVATIPDGRAQHILTRMDIQFEVFRAPDLQHLYGVTPTDRITYVPDACVAKAVGPVIKALPKRSPWVETLHSAQLSSNAAVERVLLELRNRLAHSGEIDSLYAGAEEDEADMQGYTGSAVGSAVLFNSVVDALRSLYELQKDSKFEAFARYMRGQPFFRIAIASAFSATDEFLNAMLHSQREITTEFIHDVSDVEVVSHADIFVAYDAKAPGSKLFSLLPPSKRPSRIALVTPVPS